MHHVYLVAVGFGVTLLLASLVLGGKDTDHGGDHDAGDVALGWAPFTSLRFWVFFLAIGGGAGLALTRLGSTSVISAIGAGGIGWLAGALAVGVVRKLNKNSVSSSVSSHDLVGASGILLLPVGPNRPGKVRIEIKGRSEDFVANVVDPIELPTGASVLVVAEGERGSLLVARGEM
ncbi:MAG: hypothetical protein AB7P03_16425 [Kofleriaceae bacterium]